jgi:hypothetical protein
MADVVIWFVGPSLLSALMTTLVPSYACLSRVARISLRTLSNFHVRRAFSDSKSQSNSGVTDSHSLDLHGRAKDTRPDN